MSLVTVQVPRQYGLVLLVAAGSAVLNQILAGVVSKYRKAAAVSYPNAYATAVESKASKEKYLFNCAQRSHATFLEHWPSMLLGMMTSGLRYPVTAAALGSVWIIGRSLFTWGYLQGDEASKGKGRVIGTFFYLPELGLVGLTGWLGLGLVMGW